MNGTCVRKPMVSREEIESLVQPGKSTRLWSIVLAGGNGDRISGLTHRWMGRPIAKQYCAFIGRRSMLQHTLARADMMVRKEHQLTLIARAHERDARPQLMDQLPGKVIVQPSNRDTLPGIFLPVTHVYARDSNATLIIFPSDHFIYPQGGFLRVMAKAIQAAEEMPDTLVLIGAPADRAETEYGWICPGQGIWESGGFSMHAVKRFREKPSRPEAAEALARGALWNTLIMAVKARTLWQLGWDHAPDVLGHFERLYRATGKTVESTIVQSIYETMPKRNFSEDLLTHAAGRIGVIAMEGVLWSDWGRKERIMETLRRIGRQPNFPASFLNENGKMFRFDPGRRNLSRIIHEDPTAAANPGLEPIARAAEVAEQKLFQ